MPEPADSRTFVTVLEQLGHGRVRVPVPFDPNEAWGYKREHSVGGSLAGHRIRGKVDGDEVGWSLSLGPAWLRDIPVAPGDRVEVTIAPEGPQRADLAADLSAALDESAEAAMLFDSLAQFYRKGYLRWIDATKRRPEERARRVAKVVELLAAGIKERPKDQ